MTKADFFVDPHIQDFKRWVGQRFSCEANWRHTYVDRKSHKRVTFCSIADAFRHYEWNGSPWSENFGQLMAYRHELRQARADDNADAAFGACEAILRWGGVWAHNGRTLTTRKNRLLDELRHVSEVLSRDRTPTKSEMSLGPDMCSLNAGFVKIYSVLLDFCVIYDGRVGAALGLLARQYCEERGLPEVPSALKFAYGSPKEAPNAERPKLRNPSRRAYQFPRLRRDVCLHTAQTMRANWFLQAVLESCPAVFSSDEAGFHELAAGLFMVGYDLTDA